MLILPLRAPSLAVPLFPVITTPSLPDATVGVAYSLQLSASSGLPPYVWSIVSASPNSGSWLSLSSGGLLTGTPGAAELELLTLQVIDSNGRVGISPFRLLVASGGGGSQFVHGQFWTVTGAGFGTKSRGLTPLVVDQGGAASGTLDSQWSGSEAGVGIGIVNRATPYTAPGGTTMNAPHPYVSRIIAGDCNETNTGMCKNFDRPTGDYVIRSECYFRADPNWAFTHGSLNNFKTYNLNGAYSPPLYVSQFFTYLNYDNGPYSNTDSTRQIVLDSVHDGSGGFDNPDLNGNNIFRGSGRSPWTPANGWIKSVTEWYCTSDDTAGTGGRVNMFENSHFATDLCLKSGVSPYKGRTDAMPGTHRSFLFGGYQADRGPNAYRYWADLRFDITAGGKSPGAHVAQVYIGDNPVFLSCTKLVSQVPTAWVDGSITFQVWKADLTGGTTGYVFVQPEVGGVIIPATGQSATIAVSP